MAFLTVDWLRFQRAALARHIPMAGAIDYMLKDWAAFARFLDDGRICLTNGARFTVNLLPLSRGSADA